MKLSTKDLPLAIDLYSSNTEGPSALDQDLVVLGMPKHGRQSLLHRITGSTLQPSDEDHHYLANCRHWHIISTYPYTELTFFRRKEHKPCIKNGVILQYIFVLLEFDSPVLFSFLFLCSESLGNTYRQLFRCE